MDYRLLGNTGVFVSRISLGAMTFGGASLPRYAAMGALQQPQANELVSVALEAGVNLFDTADVYSAGESEEILGRALSGRREEVLIASKAHSRVGPDVNAVGQSRLHLMQAIEGSLRRLGTDRIDLYQLHNFDPLTPVEETLRTLDDAVRQGKLRYIGCSNFAAWQVMKALGVSELRGFVKLCSMQAYYSLVGRDIEHEIVPLALDQNVGVLVWSPLAGGYLSGKFDRSGSTDPKARRNTNDFPPVDRERAFAVIDVLREIAARHDATQAQVALAWVLSRPAVTSVIVGARRPEQLAENLGALRVTLAAGELQALESVSGGAAPYPAWIQRSSRLSRFPAKAE